MPGIVLRNGLIQPAQQFGVHLAPAPAAVPLAKRVIATVAISFQPLKNRSRGSLENARHGGNGVFCNRNILMTRLNTGAAWFGQDAGVEEPAGGAAFAPLFLAAML